MVRYLIMDVDGSLTDGKIYMGSKGEIAKAFSVKDGYSTNYILKPAGIESVIITGRESKIVENRCKELGITKVYQGIIDKLSKLLEIIGDSELSSCAYFGDDVLDLKCMNAIRAAGGYVGCPADAVFEVKAIADYVCINNAGEGALREFAEWLAAPKAEEKELKRRVQEALQYIENLDKRKLENGIYRVNDNFYYLIQEYYTKNENDYVLESHKKYIDIQWIVEGEEIIGVTDVASLYSEKSYCEEKDTMFWKANKSMLEVVLKQGAYIVLYPNHAHMGCLAVNDSVRVKKIIGKVSTE